MEKMAESLGQDKELETFKELIQVAEKERPEKCNTQLGEGVAMATKVVKSFREKVVNIVKCGSEFQSDQTGISPLDFRIS